MFAPGYLSRSTGITSWVTLAIHLKESMTPEGQNETIFQYLDIQDIAIMVSSTPTAPAQESSLRWLCSFLKFLFYIGVELINNVLVSGVQPSESVTYIHTHTHIYVLRWLYSVPLKPHCLPLLLPGPGMGGTLMWPGPTVQAHLCRDLNLKILKERDGRCRLRGNVAGGATRDERCLESMMRKEESGDGGGCMQVVQPRREGRTAAGIGSSRPNDARLC